MDETPACGEGGAFSILYGWLACASGEEEGGAIGGCFVGMHGLSKIHFSFPCHRQNFPIPNTKSPFGGFDVKKYTKERYANGLDERNRQNRCCFVIFILLAFFVHDSLYAFYIRTSHHCEVPIPLPLLKCSVFASEEDYSLEKKHYKYCGVELSYASFKEYIESHGSPSHLPLSSRAGHRRVLLGYVSRLQAYGARVEPHFLRSQDRVPRAALCEGDSELVR